MYLADESSYGQLTLLVKAIGWLTSASLAARLAFRARRDWEPSEQDVPGAPGRVAAVITAAFMALIWKQWANTDSFSFLVRLTVFASFITLVFLVVYGFLVAIFMYRKRASGSETIGRNGVVAGIKLTAEAKKAQKKKRASGHRTVQELLESFDYDVDRVWTRSSRALVKQIFVLCYIGLVVSGPTTLTCSAILLLVSKPDPAPAGVLRVVRIAGGIVKNQAEVLVDDEVGSAEGTWQGAPLEGWTLLAKVTPYGLFYAAQVSGQTWMIPAIKFRLPGTTIERVQIEFRLCRATTRPADSWERCQQSLISSVRVLQEPNLLVRLRALNGIPVESEPIETPVDPVVALAGELTAEVPSGWTLWTKTSPYERWTEVRPEKKTWELRGLLLRPPGTLTPAATVAFRLCKQGVSAKESWDNCRIVGEPQSIPLAQPKASLLKICGQPASIARIQIQIPCRLEGEASHIMAAEEKFCVTIIPKDEAGRARPVFSALADLRSDHPPSVHWVAALEEGSERAMWLGRTVTVAIVLVARNYDERSCPQGGEVELPNSIFALVNPSR